jgi:signal transduction histidine kinase/DNA-binding response OmpR family regulator
LITNAPGAPAVPSTPLGGTAMQVLIVDDDELDRLAVRRFLHQSGIGARVHEATSTTDALDWLQSESCDCILLDYYMPGLSGLASLQMLQAAAPATPIVIFTGRGDEDIAVELMKAGAADYLPKASLSAERLAAGIRHAMEVTRAGEARRRAERFLRLINEAAAHLLTAADPDELIRGLFEKVSEPLGVDAYLSYVVESRDRLRLASYAGIRPDQARGISELAFGQSISGAVAQRREYIHATNLTREAEQPMESAELPGVRACYCVPLLVNDRLMGTLAFVSCTKDEFAADEIDLLRTMSHYTTAAYERLQHIAQLSEADRRKDEFLATLAHELRNPLAPLRNVLAVMKRAHDDIGLIQQAREMMDRQVSQLVRLVDDLLDASRVSRNRLALHKSPVELAPILSGAIEAAGPLAEHAQVELIVTMPDESICLYADPVRLTQVFGNLLTNACKYTDPGGRVSVSAARQGDEVAIIVKDTGIGIPKDKLDSVFNMFSQVQSALERSEGGLGIGLTLVKRLVAKHDGSVEVRSDGPGCGSEFEVRLPVIEGTPQETPAAEEETPAPVRRILVVDDNTDAATSLALLLKVEGHTTATAYEGLEALERAETFRPDVILLDIGLPRLDGYQVCRRIREQAWGRDIVVIALSGWGQEKDKLRSEDAGFDHHLVKPVDSAALKVLLRKLGPPTGGAPCG